MIDLPFYQHMMTHDTWGPFLVLVYAVIELPDILDPHPKVRHGN